MIVEKIEAFLASEDRKYLDPEFIATYMDDILNGIRRQCFDTREDKRTLRLSSIGRCLRMQAYNILDYPKVSNITPRLKQLFLAGDIVEANLICLANHAGCNITDQQLELKFNGIKGHIDGLFIDPDTLKKYVVEVKSMSDYSFQKFKRTGMSDDGFGYSTQANSYAVALDCVGIIWLGQNKNNSMMHEEIRDVDHDLAKVTFDNIDKLKLCTDPRVFPQYEVELETWYKKETGNKMLPFTCSTCDFVNTCWDGCTKYERKGKIKHYAGTINHGAWTQGGRILNEV